MKYREFMYRMKAELELVEKGLRNSQVVDYNRSDVQMDDTCFQGFLHIINTASAEAEENPDDAT